MGLGQLDESIYEVKIDNFLPGLVNSVSDTLMPIGAGDIVQNVRLDKTTGAIQKREARAYYNTASIGDNPIMYVERIYIGAAERLVMVYDTNLKVGVDDGSAPTNLDTVTASKRYRGVTYKNKHYICNGTDNNLKTDGTAANSGDMGTAAPSANPTGAKSATGSNLDDATYKYKFSWVYDSYQESPVYGTELTVATDASNKSINLHTFPTVPANATHINIYRTEGGETVYKYHSQHTKTQIAGYIAGAPYNDNTADSGLSADTAPTTSESPPKCKYILLHKDRLFMAGNSTYPSRLYYSKISAGTSYPDQFELTAYIDIAADDGDEVMGVANDPTGALCVIKRNSIRKVFTDGDPLTWSVSDPFTIEGGNAPYTITETSYGITYLARMGEDVYVLRKFDGQQSSIVSNKISEEVNKISRSLIESCEGHYHGGKYYLSFPDATTGTTFSNRVLIYNFEKDNYTVDVKDVNCFASLYGSDDRGELYTGDSQIGRVYREDTSSFDVFHKTKTEVDAGTFSQTVSGGTESAPTVTLVAADLTDNVGAALVSTLDTDPTHLVSGYDSYDTHQTVSPSGTLVSAVLELNAANFDKLYWSVDEGSNGQSTGWIRAGANSGACQAAAWNGPYWTPTGSDVSAVAGGDFVQYRIILYTSGIRSTTDSSASNHSIIFAGTAQLNTAQKKFGAASLLLDGNSDYITIPDSDDWNFGSGDFTIDCWKRQTGSYSTMFFQGDDLSTPENHISWIGGSDGAMIFKAYSGGVAKAYYSSPAWTEDNAWHHYALVRNGSNVYMFRDGVSLSLTVTTAISTNSLPDLSTVVTIGRSNYNDSLYLYFAGNIDEHRVSKGIARWTANFTPPTEAYSTDLYTKLLLPLNWVDPELNADAGYVVKLVSNLGTPAETEIPMNWRSGQLDCGQPRLMKVLKGIRVEYESDSLGTLYAYYSIDRGAESSFSIDLSEYPSKYTGLFPVGSLGEVVRLRFYQNDLNKIIIKRAVVLYSIKPIRVGG